MTIILVIVKVCVVMVRVKVCVVQVEVCVVVVQVGRSVALIHIVLEVLVVIGEMVMVVKVVEDTIVVVCHSSVVVVSRVVVNVSGTTSIIPHPISSFVVVVAASFIIPQSNGSLDARVVIMVVAFSTSKKPGVVIKAVVPQRPCSSNILVVGGGNGFVGGGVAGYVVRNIAGGAVNAGRAGATVCGKVRGKTVVGDEKLGGGSVWCARAGKTQTAPSSLLSLAGLSNSKMTLSAP